MTGERRGDNQEESTSRQRERIETPLSQVEARLLAEKIGPLPSQREELPHNIPTDIATFMEALRRTSNLFDLFAQYAGVGPAAEHLWAFFDRMPVRGSSYSRCQAWRVYIALKAAAAGDAKSALEALSWSDDLVLLMLAEQRKQGQGG